MIMSNFFSGASLARINNCQSLVTVHQITVPTLALVSFVTCLFPVAVGAIRRTNLSKGGRIFLGLLTFYVFVLITQLTMVFNKISTLWTVQLYAVIEYCAIAAVFWVESQNQLFRKFIQGSIYFYLVCWVIAKLTVESFTKYDNYTAPLSSILLVAMGVFMLIELLRENKGSVVQKSLFWISAGIVIYYAGTLPIFAMANFLLRRPLEEFANVWTINWILTIVANLLYSKAYLCKH